MVASGFIAGLIIHWDSSIGERTTTPQLGWIGVMVLLFAATLPNRPIKVLIAGALTVSMNPVGMLIARSRGRWHFEHAGEAFLMHYPDFIIVGLSALVVRVISNLGRQVTKAREMVGAAQT